MTTNVKPGDMAMIIRAYDGYSWTLGLPVTIKSSCCRSTGELTIWTFETPLKGPNGTFARCAYDRCLKRIDPLDEPADDGVKVGISDDLPVEEPVTVGIFEEIT